MKSALVQKNGRIAEIVEQGKTFRVHKDLEWRDCPNNTTVRHTWNGAGYDAPPTPEVPETELKMVERKLTTDPLERRRIKMEANRRGVSPTSIVAAILAET